MATERVDTVIVGASAAGLATSACLSRANLEHVLLERTERVACAWRGHYDRLHLHTSRRLSALPYLKMPDTYPKYPSRDQVVEYLEDYAKKLGLAPRFRQEVTSIRHSDGKWQVQTADHAYIAEHVVVATGYARQPNLAELPGAETRPGTVIHSSRYKNGDEWRGEAVLVVGFGNSGGEIAIDLVERGARPTLSVRSPVNVVSRDLFGIPILAVGIAMRPLPTRLADALSAPLTQLMVGDIEKLGLRKLPYGPNEQIRKHGRIPLLDIGTLSLIEQGKIAVRPGIDRLEGDDVLFVDGKRESFAAIVLCTGYRPGLEDLLENASFSNELGRQSVSGTEVRPGLWLCGFYVSPTGMLRQIGIEAKRIAREIAGRRR